MILLNGYFLVIIRDYHSIMQNLVAVVIVTHVLVKVSMKQKLSFSHLNTLLIRERAVFGS